jgi:hypothetical protein
VLSGDFCVKTISQCDSVKIMGVLDHIEIFSSAKRLILSCIKNISCPVGLACVLARAVSIGPQQVSPTSVQDRGVEAHHMVAA